MLGLKFIVLVLLHYLDNSEETETGENLRLQDQGYMVDALTLPNQTLTTFAEWLKTCVVGVLAPSDGTGFGFEDCVSTYYLTLVKIKRDASESRRSPSPIDLGGVIDASPASRVGTGYLIEWNWSEEGC
ncbi:hypothetical protein EVAR_13788_1 [Eumeta japonica]|uniref:Uncharacterized protein n=1 Tax=Eumeta variegata TaxID=151549 RepID=A0A4C1U153_EUMVA|nr:hypothetical protein EVAR_13788_1 [Eumeta japonica]